MKKDTVSAPLRGDPTRPVGPSPITPYDMEWIVALCLIAAAAGGYMAGATWGIVGLLP